MLFQFVSPKIIIKSSNKNSEVSWESLIWLQSMIVWIICWTSKSVSPSTFRIYHWMSRSVHQSINQSTKQTINQSVKQSTENNIMNVLYGSSSVLKELQTRCWIDLSIQSINQSTNQLTNQSISQSINQVLNHTNKSTQSNSSLKIFISLINS